MTHSCGSLHCIQTVPLRCVTESLFIAIAYVNFLVYNTRSAAVLWPNKFNTTYALHRPALDAFLHTRTDNTLKFIYIYFSWRRWSRLFFILFHFLLHSTHGLRSSIKSNSMSTAWSKDTFEWKEKITTITALTYSIHLACNKCRYHSQFITFRIFRY